MRKLTLSASLAVLVVGGSVAGAGVVGIFAVSAEVLAADTAPAVKEAAADDAAIPKRTPVRLRKVATEGFAPAADAELTFARAGRRVASSHVGKGGIAQVETLAGPHSVFVRGQDGFAVFSTWMDPQLTPTRLDVALVPMSDMPIVDRLLREKRRVTAEGQTQSRLSQETGQDRIVRSLLHGSELVLNPDGTLTGRVIETTPLEGKSVSLADARVFFIRANQVIGDSATDETGVFEINGLQPGIYTLLVTRGEAFVAISTNVASAGDTLATRRTVNEFSFVGYGDPGMPPEISLICEEDCAFIHECFYAEFEHDQFAPLPDAYGFGSTGGGGYGGGGGGGGFGGGGGLGLLLGGAALGAGIYAISEDDNDRRVISPPAP